MLASPAPSPTRFAPMIRSLFCRRGVSQTLVKVLRRIANGDIEAGPPKASAQNVAHQADHDLPGDAPVARRWRRHYAIDRRHPFPERDVRPAGGFAVQATKIIL